MNFVANKVFTDRENYKKILEDSINMIESSEKPFVKVFYGVGGQGKTAICNEFINKIIPEKYSKKIISAHVDFSIADYRSVEVGLLTIRKILSEKTKIEFSAFDLAFFTYYSITTKKENIKEEFPWMFFGENSLVNTAVDILDAVAESFPGISVLFKLGKKITQDVKNEYTKLQEEILYDLDKLTAIEIENRFAEYLAYDLKKHFLKNPEDKNIVVVFDHFEKLWENRSKKKGIGSQSADAWVRSMVDHFPKECFFVIFGRDKLQWQILDSNKYGNSSILDQHLLSKLSDYDADSFLKAIPVNNKKIRDKIIASCAGLPFYLDRQVDIFTNLKNSNEIINEDAFGKDKDEIMERFFIHLSDGLEEILSVLAVSRSVSSEVFNYLRNERFIARSAIFNNIVDHSFFEPQPEERYIMHAIMREWLIASLSKNDINLFSEINDVLFEYYNRRLLERAELKNVDSIFDTYSYEAFYHIKNKGHDEIIVWIRELVKLTKEYYRLTLLEDILSNVMSDFLINIKGYKPVEKLLIYFYLSEIKSTVGKYTEAEAIAKKAIDEVKTITPDVLSQYSLGKESIYYNYASILINNNSYGTARSFLYSEYPDNGLKMELFRKIGQNAIAEAIFWELYYDDSKSEYKYQPGVIGNIAGNILVKQKRYEEAESFYRMSINDNYSSNKLSNISVANYCLGRLLNKTSELDSSINHLQNAIDGFQNIFRKDHPYILATRREMIEVHLKKQTVLDELSIIKTFTLDFETLLDENPFDSSILELTLLINQYYEIIGKADHNILLSHFILNVFIFRYGKYFSPLLGHLTYLNNNEEKSKINLDKWIENIISVNDYKIRLDEFTHRELENSEREKIELKLRNIISLPSDKNNFSIIKYNLPFFKTFYLLEIKFVRSVEYVLYVLTDGVEFYFLNGSQNPIYAIAEKDYLFNTEYNKLYIHFFFDAVFGRNGRFVLLKTKEDLLWSSANNLAEYETDKISDQIKPIFVVDTKEESVVYLHHAIYFSGGLFTSNIEVTKKGIISMSNEKLVFENFDLTFDLHLPNNDNIPNLLNHLYQQVELINNKFAIDNNLSNLIKVLNKDISLMENIKHQPFMISELEKKNIENSVSDELKKNILTSDIKIDLIDYNIVSYKLDFCVNYKLYEAINSSNGSTILFFSNNDKFLILDWTNKSFYDLASLDFIFDDKSIHTYVRLFLDLVKGRYGRFTLIEDPDKYYISSINSDIESISKIKSLIKPLEIVHKSSEEITFSTKAVYFRNSLFSVTIKVNKSGVISLTDEILLMEDITIVPIQYNSHYNNCEGALAQLQQCLLKLNKEVTFESELLNTIFNSYLSHYFLKIREKVEECYYY